LRADQTEKYLADALDHEMRLEGAAEAAFPPILAVGARAGLPHAVPTEQRVSESSFLLVDWGAKGKFYNSDCTRMLTTAKAPAKFARIYDVVLRAQEKAIAAIRPGATGEDVDAVARSHIVEAGFGRAFGHGLGHGLGMQVHEAPSLRPGSKDVLQPGMIVTVEPGVYLKGWGGIRIEDVVLVTRDGGKVLTSLPKSIDDCVVRLAE
jgi:Xaa-Pro aminopeptidase